MPDRLLLVAHYFPPLGGVGARRSLKFAPYLPEHGWTPSVRTITVSREKNCYGQ